MTYTYEKTISENDKLVVEYVLSSVSNEIKVVEMQRVTDGAVKEHQLTWMSYEGRDSLFMELDEDMTDRACKTGLHDSF